MEKLLFFLIKFVEFEFSISIRKDRIRALNDREGEIEIIDFSYTLI